jgi:hypothetical protein
MAPRDGRPPAQVGFAVLGPADCRLEQSTAPTAKYWLRLAELTKEALCAREHLVGGQVPDLGQVQASAINRGPEYWGAAG